MSTTTKSRGRATSLEDSSLLHRAVTDRRLHQFRLLMSLGVNVDKKDPQGRTPMMVATTMEPEEFGLKLMKMCIKYNADVNEQDKRGRSVLGYACINGKAKMTRCLLQNSGHTVCKNLPDENGDVPLNLAAAYGHDAIVSGLIQCLLRDGLPVDVRNKQGCTALLLAAKYGHYRCAQILLEEGSASANLRDNEFFMSPLEWAKYSQSHFERELKLLRVITVRRSTRSELLHLHAPAWCESKQELDSLPSLTVMTSGERPNFQKKKQLLSQLRTRQTHLNSLVQKLMPKIPEKVSYSRKSSLRGKTKDTRNHITESVSSSSEDETVTPLGLAPWKSFPPAGHRADTASPYLSSLFKIYEGNVGIRPSQLVGQQAAAAVAEAAALEEDVEEASEMETPATRRKSKSLIKRHSMTSHAQNLAIPQVLRKTKSSASPY